MLLVLGLDGADWSLLEPWLAEGAMPRLAELRARAAWGALRSTIRPESSIAWATFATGVNAGRHGIFGFGAQRPNSYETRLNTSADMCAPTFWQRAAACGRKVAVCNVPMTYPPQPFAHGALIGDMLTPGLRSRFTHPPELREALLAAVPNYVLEVDRAGLSLRDFIRANTRAIRTRGQAMRWLLDSASWDAFVGVFTDTDRLQHYTLHLLDSRHPRHRADEAAQLLPELRAAYQAIDANIGDLVDAVGAGATIMVLSDHGFAPCARTFYPNVWLERHGWLKRQATATTWPGAERMGLWQRLRGHAHLRRLKQALPFVRDWKRPPAPDAALAGVDWAQTIAAFTPAGGVRFNVQGREPQGVVKPDDLPRLRSELAAALLGGIDPVTGRPPLIAVYPREELYDGPYLGLAPDLILEPRRSDPDPAANTALRPDLQAFPAGNGDRDGYASTVDLTGNHTLDGILLMAGPDIPPRAILNARLLDIAPTLLYALGLPPPGDMDGNVLPLWSVMHAALSHASAAAVEQPIPWVEAKAAAGKAFDADEEAEVADRLRALGYL